MLACERDRSLSKLNTFGIPALMPQPVRLSQ